MKHGHRLRRNIDYWLSDRQIARRCDLSGPAGTHPQLTWNCKHIANADALSKVYRLLTDLGYLPPLLVTPEEFSGNV
jgi:hypothetical protein